MDLHVLLDDNDLRRYWNRGGGAPARLWWSHEDTCYPEKLWADFLDCLLIWGGAIGSLASGSPTEELIFQDGPLALRLRVMGRDIYVTGRQVPFSCVTTLSELALQVKRACAQAGIRLRELDVYPNIADNLERSVARLETILAEERVKYAAE